MVACQYGVAGKTKDIPYPSGICQHKLSLESQAVTVAAGHLQNRLTTLLLNSEAATKGRESHYRTLVVSNIQCIYLVLEKLNVVNHLFKVRSLRWSNLTGNYKLARVKGISEA